MTTAPSQLTWTDRARAAMDAFLAGKSNTDGQPPDDLRDDLTGHVHEELRAAGVTVVTIEALRKVLAGMGETLPAGSVESVPPPEPDWAWPPKPRTRAKRLL